MVATNLPADAGRIRQQFAADDQSRWYALCGTRLYTIGTLRGHYPDVGTHQANEMGGVWAPPIKLLDGYWLGVRTTGRAVHWLTEPDSWEFGAEGATWRYTVAAVGLRATRREWVTPDASVLVVEVSFSTLDEQPTSERQTVDCVVAVRSDLHGAWQAEERLGLVDGTDVARYDRQLGAVVLRDRRQAWVACVGATQRPARWQLGKHVWVPERTSGRGTGAILHYPVTVAPEQPGQLTVLIAGSSPGATPAQDLFRHYAHPVAGGQHVAARTVEAHAGDPADVAIEQSALREAERHARARFIEPFQQCVLRSPDAQLDAVFAWAKADAAMLLLEVPTLGRALMAGLPEFPWWFGCDLAYGIAALLPAGGAAVARDSLSLLAQASERTSATGRVVHEIVSHGAVVHPGNLPETPLFTRAVYHTYRWTGDRAWLQALYPFCLRGLEQWALGVCRQPGEAIPNGSSLVETPEMAAGLQTLDGAAYLVEALDLLSRLAEELGHEHDAAGLRTRAAELREQVRREWWMPSLRRFGDVRASQRELEALLHAYERVAPKSAQHRTSAELLRRALASQAEGAAATDLRRPWYLGHMVQALALDAGLASEEQALELLPQLESPVWTERYGLVLNVYNARKVMTLPTGALAVGEARYGRIDQALDYTQRIASTLGMAMPGALSEYSPDGGCFLQLWSSYGIVWPVVHYLFGLRPDVARRCLVCAGQLPSGWPAAQLDRIAVGESRVSITMTAVPDGMRTQLETTAPEWDITLGVAAPSGAHVTQATLNGSEVTLRPAELLEYEARNVWVAPSSRGHITYDLTVMWAT